MASKNTPGFGDYLMNLIKRDGLYYVDPSSESDAEVVGVVSGFSEGERAVMEARCYAHGYKLNIEEIAPAPESAPESQA